MTRDPDDDDLIQACLEASRRADTAFDALYRRHGGAVHGFLRGLFPRDPHAARDALQETFFRFYKALPSFERGRPLRPWLLRIARNAALDARKKASAQREVGQEPEALGALATDRGSTDPAEASAEREAAGLLRASLGRLPETERAVFLLKHDQGLTYAEVASALSCSVRTAKYRMKAALEHLGREAERLGVNA